MAAVFLESFPKCGGEFESYDSGLDGLEEFGGAVIELIRTRLDWGDLDLMPWWPGYCLIFNCITVLFATSSNMCFGTRIYDGIVPRYCLQQVMRRDLTMISQSVLHKR
jgi:hypothetical protein